MHPALVVAMFIFATMTALLRGELKARGPSRPARRRRRPDNEATSLARAFPRRVLREIGADLERAAADESARLETELRRYLTGPDIGRIIGATELSTGMSLALSDGKMIMVSGVAHCSRRMVVASTAGKALQPALGNRTGSTYRLVLCTNEGPEVEFFAQRIALVGV